MSNQTNFPIVSQLLNFHSATITNGGQKANGGGWVSATFVDVEVPLTGEWYWEYITDNYVYAFMGITRLQFGSPHHHNTDFAFVQGGEYRYNGANQANTSNIGTGDIVGVYVNNGVVKVYVNNSLDVTYSQNLSVVGQPVFPVVFGSSNTTINFGQDSSFLGVKTAQNNSDGNGIGDFYYTPPGNALALCSANTPTSSDIDPAQTDSDFPAKQMNVKTYTGDGNARSITGLGFKPDLIFLKARNYGSVQQVYDSTRGGTKQLYPSQSGAEATYSLISSFDSDGWSMNAGNNDVNYSSRTFCAWCFRANGGVTSSNSNGSITSTVQSNDKAGFSIISFTASGANAQIGHGLSAKPDFHMIKKRNGSSGWAVYHKSLGATKYLRLDENSAASTFQYTYNNTEPDATKIYLGDNGLTNHPSGDTYICYAWREIPGYSKFGTYEGNGNANGPFIDCGFKVKFLAIKNADQADNWIMIDSEREPRNIVGEKVLLWDTADTEFDPSAVNVDFLGKGFKLKNTDFKCNSNGDTFVYAAWGDIPAKYNNSF